MQKQVIGLTLESWEKPSGSFCLLGIPKHKKIYNNLTYMHVLHTKKGKKLTALPCVYPKKKENPRKYWEHLYWRTLENKSGKQIP